MRPSLQAERANLRLLETLPRQCIRVHERVWQEDGSGAFPRGRSLADTERLHHRILALDAKGWTKREIADELDVSWQTVRNHLAGMIKSLSQGMTLSEGVSGKRGFPGVGPKPALQVRPIRSVKHPRKTKRSRSGKSLIERRS